MKIRESEEMYLETILLLEKEKNEVRSIDIVNELNYARSSVSVAVHRLKDKGYITINANGIIKFTQSGREKAKNIYERHRVISKLLKHIGAKDSVAEENACRIEHVISPELFEMVKKFVDNDTN